MRTFSTWLEQNGPLALGGDSDAMVHAVAHSCQMKADIVARDERESGERALLNLGHTFGHALEAVTGYSDRLLHGEGVAIGMVLAFRLSVALGLAPAARTPSGWCGTSRPWACHPRSPIFPAPGLTAEA